MTANANQSATPAEPKPIDQVPYRKDLPPQPVKSA
jgi:hypothetical protein